MQKMQPAPPTLRQLLEGCREPDRDRYLILREALLALKGTHEEVVRAGEAWLPALRARGTEIVRVRFGPAAGKGAGMTLDLNLAGRDRESLASAADLRPRTQALLEGGRAGRLRLLVRNDDDLAEGLALAMVLITDGGR